MVTYVVNISVRHEVFENYIQWLREEHIAEVLALPGFIKAELCYRKGGAMEASSKDVKVIYTLKDEESVKTYLSQFAMELREKGIEKFPGQFSANREVWLETITFTSKN